MTAPHTPEQAAIITLMDRVEALERQIVQLTRQVAIRATSRRLTATPPTGWQREARP